MTTLMEATGVPEYPSEVALELEMEFSLPYERHVTAEFQGYWRLVRDGSLRGIGVEAVSTEGFNIARRVEAYKAVDVLFKAARAIPSERCSTHAHINVQKLTHKEIATACSIFWYLEEGLFQLCGEERRGNHFCLSLREAPYYVSKISEKINQGEFYQFLRLGELDEMRYANLNIASLNKFGSLEFRAMRGTTSIDLIDKWLMMCYTICMHGKKFGTPLAFLDYVYGRDTGDVAKEILGLGAEGIEWRGVENNTNILTELAYGTNWDLEQRVGGHARRRNERRGIDIRIPHPDDNADWLEPEDFEDDEPEEDL